MRVLLALDGSPQASRACSLVGSLAWPEDTRILVLGVVEPLWSVLTGVSPYAVPEVDPAAVAQSLEAQTCAAASTLEAAGRVVESRLIEGRPASVIVDQAIAFRADLVVVGSRGLGPIRSMLLGSVSAEVVDHAPCPVLVVRAPSVQSILLAVDGSDSANRALQHLRDAPYLAGHRVEVLTVGPLVHARLVSPDPQLPDWPSEAGHSRVPEERLRSEAQAAGAVEELLDDGWDARSSIAVGDPAHEIIRAAEDLACNLIVMGSRGLTGIHRIRLGSVARNVLLHTHASVLIVRERVHAPGDDGVETRPREAELVAR